MKFAIAKEHRDFFQKFGSIEFENFLSANQLVVFNQAVNQALSKRIGLSLESRRLPSEQLFMNGRDLWRQHEELRKLVCQPRLAEIASELVEKKPIRLGYDQLFPAFHSGPSASAPPKEYIYPKFIQQTTTLEAVSCIEGLLCGLMLCLSAADTKQQAISQPAEGIDVFPSQAGHAIFFQPHVAINWENLYRHPSQRYYLIVYTLPMSQYRLKEEDPHTHALKHLGYIFNDHLNDKLNPIVYR